VEGAVDSGGHVLLEKIQAENLHETK
jgi:hypothetical protein